MSHTKIKEAKKAAGPELALDPDTLTKEFQALDKQLAAINVTIQTATETIRNKQEVIKSVRGEGQVILGKMDVLARILNGMGIDPRTLVTPPPTSEEKIEESEPVFSAENVEKMPQVSESKKDARVEAVKQRFRR